MSFPGLTKGESFVFEWEYRYSGSFMTGLAELICLADIGNRERLRLGFPEEVEAMVNYMEVSGWWNELQKKASKLGYLKTY